MPSDGSGQGGGQKRRFAGRFGHLRGALDKESSGGEKCWFEMFDAVSPPNKAQLYGP